MSKNVRSLILKSVLVVLALGLNFFAACEIGLGSSVDVESPKIDFAETTVGSGAVVRDAFAVFGTFDDDGSIGSLTAKLTNLTTGTVIEKSGKVNDSDKTWNLSFSPADEGIIDGTYDLNITIKDTADHETKISRTIIVDNTAPLVVLTRPSSRAGDTSSWDSYGQKFTLEGKAADDNEVSLIEVRVYSDPACSGSPLKTITLPNVPLTIESDVAEYKERTANDYAVIYGHVDSSGFAIRDNTTVERYCKLVVYDGAQRYPADGSAQSEEDKKGNSVEYYYLNDDLADLFTEGYKITELYHILNGSYTGTNARSTSPDGVVSILNSSAKQVTTGQFKLNPENSPQFVVSSRNTLPETIDFSDPDMKALYSITNGNGQLEVEIKPGLDGHIILKDTVGVYLVLCDDSGNPIKANGDPGTVIKQKLEDSTAKIIWLIETGSAKHEQQAVVTKSGTTYKFKTKDPLGTGSFPELAVNKNYLICVTGKDNQGNDIISSGQFGFTLTTSGDNIEVVTPTLLWVSTNSLASTEGRRPTITLTFPSLDNQPFDIYRSKDPSGISSTTPINGSTGVSGSKWIDNTITESLFAATSTTPSPNYLYYLVKDKDTQTAESNLKKIPISYDNRAPVVVIESCPDPTSNDLDTITFKGTATDLSGGTTGSEQSGVQKVYIRLWTGNGEETSATVITPENAIEAIYSNGKWSADVSYTDTHNNISSIFATKGTKTIKVTAIDGVGLTTSITKTFVYDRENPTVSLEKCNGSENIPSLVGQRIKLSGSASDDYGLKTVYLKQKKDGEEERTFIVKEFTTPVTSGTWETKYLPLKDDGTEYNDETELANKSDKYTYTIIVEDAATNTAGKGKQSSSDSKTITLHTKAPEIRITAPVADRWQDTNSVTIEGTVKSGKTVSGLYYKLYTSAPSTAPSAPSNPTVAASWTGSNTDDDWKVISGTIEEGENTWSKTIDISDRSTVYTLYVGVSDTAGNTSVSTARSFYVDASKPELTAFTYTTDGSNYAAPSGTIYVKKDVTTNNGTTTTTLETVTLYGNYKDAHSGAKALTFKLAGSEIIPETIKYSQTAITGTASSPTLPTAFETYATGNATKYKSWKAEFKFNSEGKLTVQGENNSQSASKAKSDLVNVFDVLVDEEKPVLQNLKLKEITGTGTSAVTKESYTNGSTYFVNNTANGKTFQITGLSTDDYGVSEVSISVSNTGTTNTLTIDPKVNPTGSWSFDISGIKNWSTGATVLITAKDKAGRSSETASGTINIVFDTTAPKAMHWADKNSKDVYFRIGDADNDKTNASTWETGDPVDTSTTTEANKKDPANTKVGKKYSFGSWGNDSSIEIRGAFYEAEGGSGIKTIHYAIFDDAATAESKTADLLAGTLRENTEGHIIKVGSFSPKTAESKNVPYTTSSNTKAGKTVITNFHETLAGFDAQNNFLVLVAEDNVGNREPDTLKVYEGTGTPGNNIWNSSKAYYGIKKDSQTPTITTNTEGVYTNGAGTNLTVTGTASDALSGLRDVVVTIEEISYVSTYSNFAKDAEHLNDTQTWSVSIPATDFANITSGSYTVYAKATDNAGAGNNKTISAATIYVDKTAPTVVIKSPAANSKVGETFTISGTASDGNGAGLSTDTNKHMTLYYSTKEPAKTDDGSAYKAINNLTPVTNPANGWVMLDDTIAIESEWSKNIDVSSITTDGTNKVLYFTISSTDASGTGNTGYAIPVKITIDRKAPAKTAFSITDNKKTVTEANISTTWFNSNTLNINGTFTDTDGSGVSALLYTLDGGTEKSVPTEGSVDTPIAGFTDTDGTHHTFAVRVKDAVNNYLTLSTFNIKIDTVRPEITQTAGKPAFTERTLSNGTQPRTFWFDVTDTGSGIPDITTDSNPITVKVGSTTITSGTNNSSITLGTATNGKRTATVVIGAADLASLSTGSHSVSVVVKDAAGNDSFSTSIGIINIDNDKPVPGFDSPRPNESVNKIITLSGKITDPSNSAITAVKLKAVSGSTTVNFVQDASTVTNPGTQHGHLYYANGQWTATLDTTQLYNEDETQALTLTLDATDEADNTSEDTDATKKKTATLILTIDQNSDRPIIRFTNLDERRDGAGTESDPYTYTYILKYGTNARLEGKVQDDDSTSDKVVTVFKASTYPITSETVPANTGSLESWSQSSGDFTFEPDSTDDGVKTVYFYIEDNKGGKFWTTYNVANDSYPSLSKPYQLYKTDAKTKNIATLSYKSDKTPPESTVSLNAYNAASASATGTDTTITADGVSLGANCVVGGTTKKWVDLSVTASDDNGIRGIVIKLEQGSTTKYYRSNENVEEEGITSYETTTNEVDPQDDTEAGNDYTYTTDRIDLTDFAEGQVKVTVKAYDQSGLYSNQQSAFVVDNTGPEFALSGSTKDGDIVYGIQSNTVGGSVSAIDVEKIYYAVSLSSTAPTATAGDAPADYITDDEGHSVVKNNVTGKWNLVKNAATSATLVMYDGSTTVENAFLSQSLRSWLMALQNKTSEQLNDDDTRVDMYIHFKAVDACGNEGTSVARRLSVYPNGDKPVIELVYPENKSDGTEPSLSGTIRVYGYASAAIGRVEATYLQIDPDYNGTWKTTEAANDTTDGTWRKALNTAITGTKANYPIEKIGTHNLYGIKAEGTGNWNLPINGYNEFDPDSGTRTIAIRIYALSESGKVSEPYTQVLKIDPNAPHIGASDDDVNESSSTALANRKYRLQIVDFASGVGNVGDFTKISETKAYKAEMWMKGQKYLIASVYDDSGIKTITLNEKVQGVAKKVLVEDGVAKTDAVIESHVTGQDKAIRVSQVTCGYAGMKNFNICIPLPTGSGSGSLEWEIEAVEDSTNNNRCKETIIINYDNTAPKLGTSGHDKYGIDADIHQSNGFYTMKGWATDADGDNKVSGMMGVAFYFMRRGSSSTRVYDPMYKDNYAAGKHNYVDVTGANPSGITYSNGLFWKHKAVTVTSSSKLESVLTVAADDNIHKGGLALIGGTIYRISDVSGTTVKVEGQVSLAETTADFALALVVDNLTKTEQQGSRDKITDSAAYGYGYYEAHDTADDGDLMVEDWDGTSVEGQWTAIINSANIPDGPIELHYVAFDKSQNYAVGIVGNVTDTVTAGTGKNDYWDYETLDVTANTALKAKTDTAVSQNLATNFYYAFDDDNPQPAYVSNNAPRIAGVTVGCDYNGDGSIAAGEKSSKYVGEANRFIGGEGADNVVRKATSVAKTFNASSDGTDDGNAMKTIKDKMEIELEIIGGNGNLFYQYKRDSGAYTQGSAMVAGTDYTRNTSEGETTDFVGQSYYITTKLKKLEFTDTQLKTWYTSNTNKSWWTIEVWDSTEETTPFTNSQYATLKLPLSIQVNDTVAPNTYINDLYWNSSTDNSVYINTSGDEDKLEGHIELKDYLGTGFTAANYGIDDDKISGKVVFRGYAYDNKRLKSLTWGIKDALTGTIKQAWPQASADGTVQYVTPVPYNTTSGKWGTKSGEGDEETWSYSSGNPDISSAPYYYFKVYDDEEHGAYLNENGHKVYWELTIDTSHVQKPGEISDNAWAVGKDLYVYVQATDNSNRTTNMNPTVVTTGTDAQKLKPNYKVDVVPYITGIKSLLSDNRSSNGRYQLADNETGVELIGYNLKQGSANLGITIPDSTGAYSETIHGCVTINNLNNNEATASTPVADKGKYKNKYNYQPSTYNKTLTDDVNIDLWQFNNKAAQTNTGFGFIQEPVMKFNPRNGILGFSFSNGANKFSMAQGRDNSYILWEYNYASYVRNALAFDERGRSHGISVGIDTEPSSGKSGRMNYFYSNWGRSAYDDRAGNFSNDTNSNHIDCIGIPNGNNLNSNTPPSSDWANCIIMEQRFKSVTMAATSKGSDNYTANPRVYIAYYDDIREQITFKYGEITGSARNTYGQIQSSGNPNGGDGRAFSVSGDYWSVIADGGSATPYKPGEFVDIAVKPGTSMETDVVCAVWFDATNSNLMYSYKVNPGTDHDASTRTGAYSSGYWSNATILKRKCGEYCKIAIDANGGVHITAYDKGEKGVGYVYLPSYDSTYSEANNYYIIDAVNGPYDELGIDVAVDGTGTNGKAYPTISYYANGTPKMATYSAGILKGSANKPEKAWDNNSFTGKWDICFLPTESNLLKDHINVAQPKGQDGVRARVSTTNNFASAGTKDSGTVTGNTTTNPILGYAIREGAKGYMEIAQRK